MSAVLANTNITLDNTSAITIPGTPLAGQTVIYPKADKLLYYKNDAGQELPPGKVVQVVNFQTGAMATGTTTIPIDNTIPQITEGTEFMTLVITPTNINNKLKIDVVATLSYSADAVVGACLFRDAVANALATTEVWSLGAGTRNISIAFSHFMTAGTTAAITFRFRTGGDNAGTMTFNGRGGNSIYGGTLASSITITEYTP